MNVQESKISLSSYEQGSFKPRFGKDGERIFEGTEGQHGCVMRTSLGPDFIANALKDPGPAYDLKVLKRSQRPKEYHKLSTNMKLHLHVKKFVADHYGLDFGGKIDCFNWTLI